MNFAEFRFWELLFIGLAIVAGLRCCFPQKPQWFDKCGLLFLGLFLLLCVSETTFLIFCVVAVGSYFGLRWVLTQPEQRHARYMMALIPLQLAPLLFYKYGDFLFHGVFHWHLGGFHQQLNNLVHWEIPGFRELIIPVGISFYTFQKVAFVVDTLVLKEPLPKFLDYMNFAGFFPQIVAGPIERRDDLLPQMERFRFRWSVEDINAGATWIALGMFFKCCLADNLAAFFDPASVSNPYLIWIANLLFGLRIYYDFSGYSLVALGVARCLGVRLTLNFASPYCASSAGEFWRRWHITLSQWFRDYLYIPMGGGRVRWWAFNVLLVFLISGVWHGAGWNFMLWGFLHGLFLVVNRVWSQRKLKLPAVVGWASTMIGMFLAWLCFYETRTSVLMQKMATVLNPLRYNAQALHEALTALPSASMLVLGCFLVITFVTLVLEWRSVTKMQDPYSLLRRPGVLLLLVVLTIWLAPSKNNGFIYFAF